MRSTARALALSAAVGLAAVALADVPRLISYQGRLTGNSDDPVNLQIRFYDAEAGGNELFFEEHTGVPRPNGLFSINIGSQTADGVPDSALDYISQNPNSEGLWLGVSVWDGSQWVELTPRTRLVMVPFAAKSNAAERLVVPGSFESAVSVAPTGEVGISVPSPTHQLDVDGGVRIRPRDPALFQGGMIRLDHHSLNPGSTWYMDSYHDAFRIFREALDRVPFMITANGNVGIGGYEPTHQLDIGGVVRVRSHDGPNGEGGEIRLDHYSTGLDRAWIIDSRHENFRVFRADAERSALELTDAGHVSIPVLQILGGSDLAEPGQVSDAGLGSDAVQPGMVVSIDPANPGKLMIASKPYDRRVAGVISGAGGVQPGMIMKQDGHPTAAGERPIAMAGKVYVWCDADANGPIQPGDRLTTSDTPGHAMKVTNNERAPGAVIGKAMTCLTQGKGLVLVLVQPQ